MKKSHSLSRSVRPSILVLVLFGLLAVLPWTGSIASAAAPATCEVDSSAGSASYSSLQAAINAASPGNTLEVKGICTGTSTVTKNLRIKGVTKTSILDAGGAGSTLSVNPSVSATINDLTIQNGASLLNSHFVTGGADVPWVNVGGAAMKGRTSSHSWIGSPPAPGAADSSPASSIARS